MTNDLACPAIILFRQDLRLADNPALYHACERGMPIIPVYILDDATPGMWKMGGASRFWLHHSLESLDVSLQKMGSKLHFFRGNTIDILETIIKKYDVNVLCWNRCYEPYAIALEKKLVNLVDHTESYNSSLLHEPWEVWNKQNENFKVFTPFWRRCSELLPSLDEPLPKPKKIVTKKIASESLESLKLLPHPVDWAKGMRAYWQIGEEAAQHKVKKFIGSTMSSYASDRDIPSVDGTSLLSPHLHYGEISPRQIYEAVRGHPKSDKFMSEIGWREFSYYQLYHFPKLPTMPWRSEFSAFPWSLDKELLHRWQKGMTGFPIVDAGMRQLWHTGWMHNRVRMIVASFLVKDLFIPWQEGAKWFWDTLVDADLANNSASWQWVAGCGFDAAPFFRIFNPTLQGEKFDPDGIYIKQWVPELANVPKAFVHDPSKGGKAYLGDYPEPIVDHAIARKKALDAFKGLR